VKTFFVLVTTILLTTLGGSLVLADSPLPPPKSYSKIVGKGQYIFIMLADSQKETISSSGKPYLYSGLYRNDGSTKPLWTVKWYKYGVIISSDGKYLITLGSNLMRDGNDEALAFYENGKLLKRYTVSELILSTRIMPPTASHFLWRKDSTLKFDDKKGELSINTYYFNKYVFNVRTGEIVGGFKYDLIILLLLLLTICYGIYHQIKKKSARKWLI
jgi:hypothetical protein